MSMMALDRINNPLLLVMNRDARIAMNTGRQELYSARQPSATYQDTAPLQEQHPSSSARPATNKGRGKGKAQQHGAQWEGWYGWSDRGWDSW